jgi:hypothetical protein|tara:strand:+ start:1815 stop:2072 length:258 start_codon:yes stop_codon:yes gene_type:complete
MKKPNKVTITFNPDHEGVYLLLGIDDDFHKIYISEQQHGNILQSCVDSYFKKKSIALLNDAIKIEKDSEKLLEKTERMLRVMKHI